MIEKLPHAGLHLEFLPNPAEEDEGLGHAGIETYRDEPYAGTARETGQNSRDAYDNLPVRISFDVLDIPRGSIPAIDALQSIIETCLEQVAGQEKESAFFQQALKVVSGTVLKVLRIADFNTTGARGPSVKGTPFHSLLKASGVSIKDRADSGGSFGIGKNAVFAASDLQTVFYSTVYKEGSESRFLAQGKVILVSHRDATGQPKRQTGYWGLSDFRPINDPAKAPEWLQRTEVGTSVFILGFRETQNWQSRIIYSLIQNFFPAIHNGEMEFALDEGRFEIGRIGLASLFDGPTIRGTAKANDRESEFDLSRSLYRCLVSPEAKEEIIQLPALGRVQIRVLVAEGLPKKVIIIRNGMIITDSLEHFGDKFVRFPMYRDFVAVVTPLEGKGSSFIKKLEDPKHHELSPERLPDAAKREEAKAVMKRFAHAIRDAIKAHTLTKFDSEVSVDEMRRYFAAESEPSANDNKSKEEDPQAIRYKIEPRKERRRLSATSEGTGDSGTGVGGPSLGPGPGPDPHPGPPNPNPVPRPNGPGGNQPVRVTFLEDVRNVRAASGSARQRKIYFTPAESGTAEITLQATGLNENVDLTIRSASDSIVSGERIKRRIVAYERICIDVEFVDEYAGPIDIRVNIVPDKVGA
jgi:hypothetical protein